MILAINASRARSGGARAHLIGIIDNFNPEKYGFSEVHVWSYQELLAELPEASWLVKRSHPWIEKSLPFQIMWELFYLKKAVKAVDFNILLNVDAGTFARVSPSICMSRDMLSYEPGEMERWPWGFMRFRLLALKYIQNSSLRNATGVIFLTKYASMVIQKSCGRLANTEYISHGVGQNFLTSIASKKRKKIEKNQKIRCIYISPVWLFKHQWNVVNAIHMLRSNDYNMELLLVGGGDKLGLDRLFKTLDHYDPERDFVTYQSHVPHDSLPEIISNNDIFVFASSCENMPNTVLEGMASGIPIACSNRGPMPEVLKDGGIYFDPENPLEIARSIEAIILDEALRNRMVSRSTELVRSFSWEKCANETLRFSSDIASTYSQGG